MKPSFSKDEPTALQRALHPSALLSADQVLSVSDGTMTTPQLDHAERLAFDRECCKSVRDRIRDDLCDRRGRNQAPYPESSRLLMRKECAVGHPGMCKKEN